MLPIKNGINSNNISCTGSHKSFWIYYGLRRMEKYFQLNYMLLPIVLNFNAFYDAYQFIDTVQNYSK